MKLRTLPISIAIAALFCTGLAMGTAGAEDPVPCTNATLPKVKAACEKGGRAEVKKLMKSIVDKAKAAGKEIKCNSCHENLKDFKQTANAQADLKALL
jgi:hypothetical protein